jgi:Methyltransferase domain
MVVRNFVESAMIDIERAKSIDGWMNNEELTFLAEQAKLHSNIVEIGSWKGRSTRALIDNAAGQVTAVDTWAASDSPSMAWVKNVIASKPDPNWVRAEFDRNTGGTTNLRTLQMTSLAAAVQLQDERFDMIFIDGDHDIEPVYQDILAWKNLLVPGGLLCGHDAKDPSVTAAVIRAFGERTDVSNTDIWMWNAS